MNKFEYDFLTDNWEHPKGAAYNAVRGFCKAFGWLKGFDPKTGAPILTEKGLEAVKKYQQEQQKG